MDWLWACIVGGFLLAGVAPWADRRWPRLTPPALALTFAGTFVALATLVPRVADAPATVAPPLAPPAGLTGTLAVDGLSVLFALLVTGVGSLVLLYTGAYKPPGAERARLYAALVAFGVSMFGLVLSDDLVLLFVFWELTGLSSFFLIGGEGGKEARFAANQALVITATGGLALFAAILIIWGITGTTSVDALLQDPDVLRLHPSYLAVVVLVAAAAFTKSAQMPLHFWLPSAMVAPTPVSAYLHSATMVKAGVFLLARLFPVLGATTPWWVLLVGFGGVTMVLGAWFALRARDAKRALAFSTISTLGTLVLLIGIGTVAALEAALVLVLAHALYKAALFLVAGSVEHATGSRDLTTLGGLGRAMPFTATAAVVAGAGLAGLPPMLSFIGKELAFDALLHHELGRLVLVVARVVTTMMLVAFAIVVGVRPFFGARPAAFDTPKEVPLPMLVGPAVLALGVILLGMFPTLVGALLTAAAGSVHANAGVMSLALWHGFTPAVWLSLLSFAAGGVLFFGWRFLQGTAGAPDAAGPGIYASWYDGLKRVSRLFVRHVQVGQLTVYLATTALIATSAGLVPLYVLGTRPDLTSAFDVAFHEAAIAVVLFAGALLVALARAPLAAVIGLGTVGYAVALIFVSFGAPDLAMTQFLVETVAALLFLLVIPRFGTTPRPTRMRRKASILVAVPVLFGLMMGALTLLATQSDPRSILAPYYLDQAVPLGHGRNVVNVILVDFRAIDTLAEVTVLAAAGLGILALLGAMRTGEEVAPSGTAPVEEESRRSVVLQTLTGFIVALLVVYSIFLLLRGHDRPGGGFVGGLIAAAAVGLHALTHDLRETRHLFPVKFVALIPLGLAAMLLSGLVGLPFGHEFLTGRWIPGALPVLDGLKVGTPLLFDAGVYLTVLGMAGFTMARLGEDV